MTNPTDDQTRITPDGDGFLLHLPEVTSVDTQVWAVDIGLTADGLRHLRDALAAAPAVPLPSVDRAALRARIAETVLHAVESALGDTLLPAAREEALAGIVAVLPAPEPAPTTGPAGRAAKAEALLLRFTAEAHRRKWNYGRGLDDDGIPIKDPTFDALHRLGEEMRVELEKLRRMADETQPAVPQRDETLPAGAAPMTVYLATPCDACGHTLNWHRNDVGCTVPRCVCGRFQEPAAAARQGGAQR